MTRVSTGAISLGGNTQVSSNNQSIEYEVRSSYGNTTAGTSQISLNDSAARTLPGGPSGTAGEIRATNNITSYYSDGPMPRLGVGR